LQLNTMAFNLEQSMKSLERYETSVSPYNQRSLCQSAYLSVGFQLNIESERTDRYTTMRQNEMMVHQNEITMHQNEITMHQNENIEKLTYLTIVYLPITLMAVRSFPLILHVRRLS